MRLLLFSTAALLAVGTQGQSLFSRARARVQEFLDSDEGTEVVDQVQESSVVQTVTEALDGAESGSMMEEVRDTIRDISGCTGDDCDLMGSLGNFGLEGVKESIQGALERLSSFSPSESGTLGASSSEGVLNIRQNLQEAEGLIKMPESLGDLFKADDLLEAARERLSGLMGGDQQVSALSDLEAVLKDARADLKVTDLNLLEGGAPKRLQEGLPSIGSLLDRASGQIDGGLSGQSADEEQTALQESLQGARTRLSSVSNLEDIFTVDGLLADVRKRLSESPSFAASTELQQSDSLIGRARDSLRNLRLFRDATPELTPSAPTMEDVPTPPASTVETTQVEETVTETETSAETVPETEVAEIAEERPEEVQALQVADEQSELMQDQVITEPADVVAPMEPSPLPPTPSPTPTPLTEEEKEAMRLASELGAPETIFEGSSSDGRSYATLLSEYIEQQNVQLSALSKDDSDVLLEILGDEAGPYFDTLREDPQRRVETTVDWTGWVDKQVFCIGGYCPEASTCRPTLTGDEKCRCNEGTEEIISVEGGRVCESWEDWIPRAKWCGPRDRCHRKSVCKWSELKQSSMCMCEAGWFGFPDGRRGSYDCDRARQP
uniref:EGF-like domain-containing protein n=1 Tax=Chromera velia CCMP2878 TaxID=1169474 RepID=A0A0G4GHG8_9ALVE|mmetsp:Transcript_8514/g.16627  ORF Transcript_8514/g.16627 Transcript_8514/m.16627 type:complete len:610 (-) Transcript_8514:629-2458(-)|eukprot:Cvel_650.t1-p1 / transcript=Cvel_650.t1 / gene=Cvel_650 / organism=Chromera_velia_CCMP2878 / gene_product=hypothetical protein / transcript_product=hypothetical protein / location=Cvel_scaffold20:27829-30144(-) / protein_length=609 / sequence_SO=supercontig / SO=protein_coding / is_pseudo=false